MRFLSLFSGIGGFELGLERAGHECVGQVEIDPFCRRVLAKHWPNVWRWDDVRTLTKELCDEHCGRIDFICGGFPCQDISEAGKRAGLAGERSGLWFEYLRIIRDLRPAIVVVENVSDLLIRGFGRVLGDLAECGIDAEWHVLPASAFGAPHPRERVFVVGYAGWSAANANGCAWEQTRGGHGAATASGWRATTGLADVRNDVPASVVFTADRAPAGKGWPVEPDIRRVGNGIPDRVERTTALGNAIVPQVAQYIGELLPLEIGGAA